MHVQGVRFSGAETKEAVDAVIQDRFLTDGTPSEKKVSDAVTHALGVISPAAKASLPSCCMVNSSYYDNSALYAKLWYYSFLRDMYTHIQVVPVGPQEPWADPGTPIFTNVTPANLGGEVLPNIIESGHITVRYNKDVFPNDLQVLNWVTHPEVYMDSPNNGRRPHGSQVNWQV
jgi:hypothetical protein